MSMDDGAALAGVASLEAVGATDTGAEIEGDGDGAEHATKDKTIAAAISTETILLLFFINAFSSNNI